MPTPVMMFDHALSPLKGWFSPYAIDFSGKLDATVTTDPVYAGRVVHCSGYSSTGIPQFKPGHNGRSVPIFLLNGTDQLDVNNPGGNHWKSIAPAGFLSGLVGIACYELESTEFDTAQTYLHNEYLRAVRSDSAANAGTLTNQIITLYTTSVCAQVSRGKRTNQHGVSTLSFWTHFLPGSEATS